MSMNFTVSEDNLNSLVRNGWDFNIPSNYETKYMTGHSGYDNPMQGSIASFFGRVNWNYDEKYMATAILRADGSSNFARGKRWGYFPSFSAGWVITNENFMESTKTWLDFLKFRASWGQNGNCNISNLSSVIIIVILAYRIAIIIYINPIIRSTICVITNLNII